VRRFRRLMRKDMGRDWNSERMPRETRDTIAVIAARHWVMAGLVSPCVAIRGAAMVTGTPLEVKRINERAGGRHTRLMWWPPARGETWQHHRQSA
jgi:hypothetical protein